ncbi:MAG: hypothetical protein ACE5H5_04675 [Nitrospinota bacterium]
MNTVRRMQGRVKPYRPRPGVRAGTKGASVEQVFVQLVGARGLRL